MLNLLVNLWVLVFFVIFIGYELTQIMLHHIFSWCYYYLGLSIHLKRRRGHEPVQITHQDNFNCFPFTFRDDYSEYEDYMDISKCIPSIMLSDLSLRDPLEKQITLVSSSFSPNGAIGLVSLLVLLKFIQI